MTTYHYERSFGAIPDSSFTDTDEDAMCWYAPYLAWATDAAGYCQKTGFIQGRTDGGHNFMAFVGRPFLTDFFLKSVNLRLR